MERIKALLAKRVFGVPVSYIILALSVVGLIIAVRMKASVPATEADGTAPEDEAPETAGGLVTTGDFAGTVYDGLKTSGTVVVAPVPPDKESPAEYTNEQWVRDGVTWLTITKKIASGTEASSALQKYVNGQDRSYAENELVDKWIAEKGAAPDLPEGGNVGVKPAAPLTPQFDIKKGSGYHVVKGKSDDMYGPIMLLYWSRGDQVAIDYIQSANTNLAANGPFPVGTRVFVPQWKNPKYIILKQNMTNAQIAAANGITLDQFNAFNNRPTTVMWYKGGQVRVA